MASSQSVRTARRAVRAAVESVAVFARDVGHGSLEVMHNTLALLGMLLAVIAIFAASRADVQNEVEWKALSWLEARLGVRQTAPVATAVVVPSAAVEPATTDDAAIATPSSAVFELKDLSRPQAAVAQWLARRYRVAPEPVGALVKEAWQVGTKAGLDPTLILAIMAVESSFNPFAQSAVGAQGLMQVMTNVHNAKYTAFGGKHAAFDPVTNLRVGVEVLKECISRAGSLEAGLRFYVGAGNQGEDGGYAGKVLSEQHSLRQVVGGKPVPTRQAATAPAKPETAAAVPAVPAEEEHAAPEQIALAP